MKSTKNKFFPLILFLLTHLSIHAQYSGGVSDGNSQSTITNNVCGTPPNYFAYIGGSGDGNSVQTVIISSCGTPPGGFAYIGGTGDGNGLNTTTNTTCGLAPGAFAYAGGPGDGQGLQTFINNVCPAPPQFYAYFGSVGDGSITDKSLSCAIILPVADFTATPTSICVTNNVTFTDTSTNAVAWEWTFTGGTLVSPFTINSQNPVVKYNTAGTYAVTLKALNHDGSDIRTRTAYIIVNATATVTTTTPGSRCGTGSVLIVATPNSGVIRWYSAATAGTLLSTGDTFNTPSISVNTTYFAEAFNGCVSTTRTAVLATINTIPTISGNPASRCDAGTVGLSANASAGTVTWYNAAVGGTLLNTGSTYTTPSISSSTSYFTETITTAGCKSPRIEVIATVNNTPTITATTNASSCGGAATTITATPSAGSINWYTASTAGTYLGSGNALAVSGASANYFAEATNNGCTSARTSVSYTSIIVPTLVSTTPNTRCGNGTVVLSANYNSGTVNWYDAPSGGSLLNTGNSFTTPSISVSTTYYVLATNASCSTGRTAVTATVTNTSAPSGSANQTFCGGETVGLIAVSGTNVIWYNAATNGTVVPNNTVLASGVTYFASQTLSGCESNTRLAVTMTSGSCLDVSDFDATNLKLYPNPVTDYLKIENSINLSKIEITNMLGQVIYNSFVNSNTISVDMSQFANATYLVKIFDFDNKVKVIKIIKR